MGVSGLHSWAESRGLGTRVVLTRQEEERVIVFDGCAGMLTFYGIGSLVGDFAAMRRNVAAFVARFTALNIRVVVVLDGAVQPEKFAEWSRRRRSEVKTVQQINGAMHGGARLRGSALAAAVTQP